MELFLFIIENRPGYRRTLHEAQAVLEDHLRDRRDVSDVWWDDDEPHEARVYYYGSSHSDAVDQDHEGVDFETTGRIIWPIAIESETPPRDRIGPLEFGGAEMTLTVRTRTEKRQVIECVTEKTWDAVEFRPYIISHFAAQAGQTLASNWTSKEST